MICAASTKLDVSIPVLIGAGGGGLPSKSTRCSQSPLVFIASYSFWTWSGCCSVSASCLRGFGFCSVFPVPSRRVCSHCMVFKFKMVALLTRTSTASLRARPAIFSASRSACV